MGTGSNTCQSEKMTCCEFVFLLLNLNIYPSPQPSCHLVCLVKHPHSASWHMIDECSRSLAISYIPHIIYLMEHDLEYSVNSEPLAQAYRIHIIRGSQ
jgi:hypothetical protein